MLSISLGPIALPLSPLLLLLAVWFASWLASALAERQNPPQTRRATADAAGQAVFVAAGLGLLTARLVHLALNAAAYLAQPASMLDLRDGGWHTASGVAAGAAWLIWRGWRAAPTRRPLAWAGVVGLLVWTTATQFLGAPRSAPMSTLALLALDDGRALSLQEAAAGRPVVVNLWASWCGPCRQEMPTLAQAQQREQGVGFIFVNQGEPAATVQAYLAGLGLPLREVLLDAGSRLGPAVGSPGLPTTLFYDARGQLVDAHFGVLNAAALESRLKALRPTH